MYLDGVRTAGGHRQGRSRRAVASRYYGDLNATATPKIALGVCSSLLPKQSWQSGTLFPKGPDPLQPANLRESAWETATLIRLTSLLREGADNLCWVSRKAAWGVARTTRTAPNGGHEAGLNTGPLTQVAALRWATQQGGAPDTASFAGKKRSIRGAEGEVEVWCGRCSISARENRQRYLWSASVDVCTADSAYVLLAARVYRDVSDQPQDQTAVLGACSSEPVV
ncbi:hypothetical protein CTAM01_13730 [Colletotrichum tamarilloi]|uniref:Uncharacterized protein n=1 Tax=Colletotrichum tamarilloi TaxID=1209934 RepID=A0ABQ9QRA0_9PEZI|nr:uncharacterized protein CTAM01_13730 [Colletotrichum tamarilloi]KAK1482090.1 hypothetical protein CTAM01_13730 [Colletotrichum tamarilloi]